MPFAHKSILADRIDYYDLFIYSEDDILITERNICAFIEQTKIVPKNAFRVLSDMEWMRMAKNIFRTFFPDFIGLSTALKSMAVKHSLDLATITLALT